MSKNQDAIMAPFDPSVGKKTRKVPLGDVAKAVSKRIGVKIPSTSNVNPQDVLKFCWANLEDVFVNYGRQRFPEPKHQLKVYTKWDIHCVTPLHCRYDPKEKRFYVSDGQQHGSVWAMQYGLKTMVPVFYVESEDENIESIQLMALNTGSEPMAKYFIHQTAIQTGDKAAIDLEKTLTDVDCYTSYKKKTPGAVTHISHLWQARDGYGLEDLGEVIGAMRRYWPQEKIAEPTLLGYLKLKEILQDQKVYTEELLSDIIDECSNKFSSAKDMHLHINHAFMKKYPTNYKGMGVREKIASGIISIYEQIKPGYGFSKPFEITVSIMSNEIITTLEDDTEDELA
jgi:hypothetical protein